MNRANLAALACASLPMGLIMAGPAAGAQAQVSPGLEARLARLEAQLSAQEQKIADQDLELLQQRRQIKAQQDQLSVRTSEINPLRVESDTILAALNGRGEPVVAAQPSLNAPPGTAAQPAAPMPDQPVGQAPAAAPVPAPMAATPPEATVLTPLHHLTLEPSADYTYSGSNILVFRGVEIVPGVQLGVIEASNTLRAAESVAMTARYGLLRRLEIEARVPYVWRADRIGVVQQRDTQVRREISLSDQNLGDVEVAARYQFNRLKPDHPVFIGGLRIKSDTGTSPFTIGRDSFGVAQHLATGSGYWTAEPSLTMIYPTDPAVFFITASALGGLTTNINKTIDGVYLRKVIPGGSMSLSLGYGFAVNQRFSYSVAYRHSYLMPTVLEIGTTKVKSKSVQIGGLSLGVSYRLSDRVSISTAFQFGTTPDAPDTSISFRVPIAF
jgi:uncharacterized coiled-coil protein SlyX